MHLCDMNVMVFTCFSYFDLFCTFSSTSPSSKHQVETVAVSVKHKPIFRTFANDRFFWHLVTSDPQILAKLFTGCARIWLLVGQDVPAARMVPWSRHKCLALKKIKDGPFGRLTGVTA